MSKQAWNSKIVKKNPLAPMGVLAPVSAHGTLRSAPIGTSGNFPARVSAESISPNFPIFGQNRVNRGCRGIPKYFFHWIPNIFITYKPMQNTKTVAQTLLGETAHFGFCPSKNGFFGRG